MKKINTMRAAGGLLIATLLSTSAVSGTYAKYVSGGSAGDTARVAKWGVVISATGNLFSKNYLVATNTPTASTTDANISVESSNTDMLVAPGTKSATGLSFSISGTPEVDALVTATIDTKDVYLAEGSYGLMKPITITDSAAFNAAVDEGNLFSLSGSAYTPLSTTTDTTTNTVTYPTFTSGTTYYQLDTATIANVAEGGYYPVKFAYGSSTSTKAVDIGGEIAKALNGGTALTAAQKTVADGTTTYSISKTYDSNTDLATELATSNQSLSWEWKYNGAIDDAWNNVDYEDTILGDLAAGTTGVVTLTYDGTKITGATKISADATTGLVSDGTNTLGCIRETFNISMTAVQVD